MVWVLSVHEQCLYIAGGFNRGANGLAGGDVSYSDLLQFNGGASAFTTLSTTTHYNTAGSASGTLYQQATQTNIVLLDDSASVSV